MLDEEVSTSKSENVYTNTVSVIVRSDVDQEATIQLWPCVHVPTALQIPQAVKEIYSRLAQAAAEPDQGMPCLLLSLIGTGNGFSNETVEQLHKGLKRFVGQCGLWAVTSGEYDDPLARVFAQTLRCSLAQLDDPSETLVIVANNSNVIHKINQPHQQSIEMVDSRYNTLYVLLKDVDSNEQDTLAFRCRLAMKLSSPPPALLIGVPDERSTFYSTAQTPITSTGPAIILPNSLMQCERKPMPVALFCGASVKSLLELSEYIECGVPVLMIQDISELCAILRNSLILYNSAGFEHSNFIKWLDNELRSICGGEFDDTQDEDTQVEWACEKICRILSSGIGSDRRLLSFVPLESVGQLPEHILELFIQSMVDSRDLTQLMELALKLNAPSIVRQMSAGELRPENINAILEQVLANESSVHVLSALLDQRVPLTLTADLLYKWFECTFDKYFFQAIVLGSLLGYTQVPESLDESLAYDINNVLRNLSGGVKNLFPAHLLFMPLDEKRQDQAQTIQIMAVWALLLNQLEVVKCLCAYAPEPLGLSIVLAKIARSLAHESREWFFFEQRLNALSDYLCLTAHQLLSDAFDESPVKAYKALCYKSEVFNQLTVPQLAYETTTRAIIAHECCQRWVLRLLYGNLQLVTVSRHFRLSNWLKIVICALFVLPIRWWIARRPAAIHRRRGGNAGATKRTASPTVAMLEMGRQQPKRTVGAFSTYSTHSGRSYYRDDYFTRETTPFDMHPHHQIGDSAHDNGSTVHGHQPETPQSATFMANPVTGGNTLDDVESSLLYGQMLETRFYRPNMSPQPKQKGGGKLRPRRAGLRDLVMFYSTPIVKYWLSLVFRLAYLTLFAYTLILPSCLNEYMELAVWIWSLMWFCESMWVLSVRLQTSSASEMKWRIFDLCLVGLFLLSVITLRLTSPHFWSPNFPKLSYVLKTAWTYFLIYQCYATLFVYIPMSDVLGPFMIRIKLMITRDFFYYSVLISLVVISTIVAVKAIIYPDLSPSYKVASNIFGWTWLSLFTTDLNEMKESGECRKFAFYEDRNQCRSIGGYSNPWCPTQGPAASITIYQYLVVLKLISWPILFALFARTAKEVDEEADHIWKYQLYSLAVDFSLRPFLPPPFTFLFFLCVLCRRMTGCISDLFSQITKLATDHPDARVAHGSPALAGNMSVYQNPSIPPSKPEIQRMYWGAASIRQWKKVHSSNENKAETQLQSWADRRLTEKLQLLVISSSFERATKHESKRQKPWHRTTNNSRLSVEQWARDWSYLVPDYRPPFINVPFEQLPVEAQRSVDDNLAELLSMKTQKLNWHINNDPKIKRLFSSDGLPLNPFGRTGLKGRNTYARYGSNMIFFYVIFALRDNKNWVLIDSSTNELPKKWKYGALRADEYLSDILTQLKVPDADIQRFSTRSHMPIGQIDSNIAHVCVSPLPTPQKDTDNAWTEADLWAVCLNKTSTSKIDEFTWKALDSNDLPDGQLEFVQKSAQLFKLIDQ